MAQRLLLLLLVACAPARPPPAPAVPHEPRVVVLDAESGAPLAGATVTELAIASGPAQREGCESVLEAAPRWTGVAAQHGATTDAEGRAFLEGELPSDDSAHCFPGQPCAVRKLAAVLVIEKDGFVRYASSGEWNPYLEGPRPRVPTVRLVGPHAKVRTPDQAAAIAQTNPELARIREHLQRASSAWFWHGREHADAQPLSCLTRAGVWNVTFSGAMLRTDTEVPFAPWVEVEVDPFTAVATFVSCPDSGTPMDVVAVGNDAVRLRDRVTAIEYACAPCSSEDSGDLSWCERPLRAGERLTAIGSAEFKGGMRCLPPAGPTSIGLGEHVLKAVPGAYAIGGVYEHVVAKITSCRPQ